MTDLVASIDLHSLYEKGDHLILLVQVVRSSEGADALPQRLAGLGRESPVQGAR